MRALALGIALLCLAGCARGSVLRGRVDGIADIAEQAERNGAYRCAPRELAVAKAQIEFARAELGQGNTSRAEEHFEIAEPNARAAFRLSPAARCSPRQVVVTRRAPGDRDGDGIRDPSDECPDEPEDVDGFEDQNGCPDDQDTDGDGLSDNNDQCILEPEDTDGFLDSDGCPEPDNDLDQIADATDRCANDAEDPDGYQEDDGCPDRDNDSDGMLDAQDQCPNEPGPEAEHGCPRVYQDVQVTGSAIRITQTIYFQFNRAVIQERSFGLLNTVAQVMRDFPTITVEIQGHTDSRGNDDYNMRLSDERANAVRTYLIEQGIEAPRMTARGYGETQPIESNRTSTGRAANRRVEFIRTDNAATGQPTP